MRACDMKLRGLKEAPCSQLHSSWDPKELTHHTTLNNLLITLPSEYKIKMIIFASPEGPPLDFMELGNKTENGILELIESEVELKPMTAMIPNVAVVVFALTIAAQFVRMRSTIKKRKKIA